MNVIERDSTPHELILAPHDVMTADNAPLLLTRTARQSSVVVRYSRVERWDVVRNDTRATIGARPKQLAFAALGGVGVGALVAMAFAASPQTPATAGGVSVAISPPPAQLPAAAAPSPVATAARVRAARTATVALPVAATVVAPAAAITPTLPETESAALAQAFSSNEAVSWRGAATMGTVVVGAASIEQGRYCRDVAILTRSDNAADRTVNSRKCLEPGGRISDRAAPTPQ